MGIVLTAELEEFVRNKEQTGRYADANDVVRDALRTLELRDDYESPALEAALLEGVRSPHQPYSRATLERIRSKASAGK